MITLTDQIAISLPLPIDSRASNLVLSGNSIKVETLQEYLDRIDLNDRYLGLEVIIYTPAGTYGISNFMIQLQLGNMGFSKYKFTTIDNEGLTLVYDSVVIINNLTTGGISEALSAEQGVILKEMIQALTERLDNI